MTEQSHRQADPLPTEAVTTHTSDAEPKAAIAPASTQTQATESQSPAIFRRPANTDEEK